MADHLPRPLPHSESALSTGGRARPTSGMRALVVEDEVDLAALVGSYLDRDGFEVTLIHDGSEAVKVAREVDPDVIVLDLGLPGLDGVEVCRQVRTFSDAYVVMLTARSDEVDTLIGLSVGADDYLTKPFSLRELAARVHALLRRMDRALAGADTAPITLGDLEINSAERRVRRAGAEVHLTPTEFDLLVHLASRPRTVLPRERLLAEVWGWADASGTRTVDSHVKALRRKLGADVIRTVHGVGYSLEVPA